MGNCLNKSSRRRHRGGTTMPEWEGQEEVGGCLSLSETRRIGQVLRQEEEEVGAEEEEDGQVSAPAAAEHGLKVKIVLTRAELEWLMAQLKGGERRLEDVLHHMRAVKDAAAAAERGGWRPRLESILECSEAAAAAT